MIDKLEFQLVNGDKDKNEITVYALSTCGFCKRGLEFLRKNSIKFRFVYVDDLTNDEKQDLKKCLEDKYKERVRYPYLIINDTKCLVGFNEEEWEKTFLKE